MATDHRSTLPGRLYRPPFRKGLLNETIALLEQHGWLADDAVIYTESEIEQGDPVVPQTWSLHREKSAGQVSYRLYHRQASPTGGSDAT